MNLCSIYKQIKYVCLVCAHAYNTEKVKSFLSFQFSISVFVVHFFMFFFLHAGAIHIKQHYVVCICHVCAISNKDRLVVYQRRLSKTSGNRETMHSFRASFGESSEAPDASSPGSVFDPYNDWHTNAELLKRPVMMRCPFSSVN